MGQHYFDAEVFGRSHFSSPGASSTALAAPTAGSTARVSNGVLGLSGGVCWRAYAGGAAACRWLPRGWLSLAVDHIDFDVFEGLRYVGQSVVCREEVGLGDAVVSHVLLYAEQLVSVLPVVS